MITVHFCVVSFDPARGGMEGSARRIIESLSGSTGFRCVAYLLGDGDPTAETPEGVEVIRLGRRVRDLITEVGFQANVATEHWRGWTQQVILRDAVHRKMRARPHDRHVLLSFYFSTVGFVAQLVSKELGLPHVACSRGSDFGHDLFNPRLRPEIDYVARGASCVVTTSHEHARYARDLLGYPGRIETIYNALPIGARSRWRPQARFRVRLVSAVGYSFKKGTHLLLESVCALLAEGFPVELCLFGRTTAGGWTALRQRYAGRMGIHLSLAGWLSPAEVEARLLGADIYCTATLSEGCPNATMLALALGLPTVASATGAPQDFMAEATHVALVPPGDVRGFTEALRSAVRRTIDRSWTIDARALEHMIEALSPDRETTAWRRVLSSVM